MDVLHEMESILKCVACSVDYYDQLISYQLMLLCSRIIQEVTNNINTYYYFSTGSCIYNLKITSYKHCTAFMQHNTSSNIPVHSFIHLLLPFLRRLDDQFPQARSREGRSRHGDTLISVERWWWSMSQ